MRKQQVLDRITYFQRLEGCYEDIRFMLSSISPWIIQEAARKCMELFPTEITTRSKEAQQINNISKPNL